MFRHVIKFFPYIIILLWTTESLLADELEFYRIYRSAYFLGRGDTGIADAEDHEAIFYNPAGLAVGKGLYKETVFVSPTLIMSTDTKNLARKMLVEEDNSVSSLREHVGKNQHIAVNNFSGIVFRRMALGVVANTQNNLLLYKSPENRAVELLDANSVTNTGLTFSVAESFADDFFAIGTTVKYLNQTYSNLSINVLDAENISDQLSSDDVQNSYTGAGADIGIRLQGGKQTIFKFGLTLENAGTTVLQNQVAGRESRTLPQFVNLGLSADFGTRMSRMKFHLDVRDLTNEVEPNYYKKIHIGTELDFAHFFGFAAGLNQGYPSAGVYMNLYLVRFDLGAYTQEVGDHAGVRPDNRFFFRVCVGI